MFRYYTMVLPLAVLALAGCSSASRIDTASKDAPGTHTLTGVVISLSAPAPPLAAARDPVASLGAVAPDVELRNQDDQPVRLADLRGRVLVVNFIYTRCPLPEYCPRLMSQSAALQESLASQGDLGSKVRFLSVTFDPQYDTPDVLRAYGARVLGGADPFDRWDLATGSAESIARLAAFVGVSYEPVEGWVQHSLESAVVGADGRLVKRFASGGWRLEDALAVVAREARRVALADPHGRTSGQRRPAG